MMLSESTVWSILLVYALFVLFSVYLILKSEKSPLEKALWILCFVFLPFLFVFYLVDRFLINRMQSV